MCGENALVPCAVSSGRGSPPRVRGKRDPNSSTILPLRITPACAGKTDKKRSVVFTAQDHPRVCGENISPKKSLLTLLGSPPRVRGKRQHEFTSGRTERITPACAGKTDSRYHRPRRAEDHPRVCGENVVEDVPATADVGSHPRVCGENSLNPTSSTPLRGSPPRVRGKPRSFIGRVASRGITPACAGKTAQGPRACR